MGEQDWLAQRFEEHRVHLRKVAYRMLGSFAEADEAVQDVWLRLSRSEASSVENLGGWLTTIVGRVCLNILRSRNLRREEPLGVRRSDPILRREGDPEQDALLADSVGLALQVVLDTLEPAERLAFVFHDLFDLPFDEIAPMLGRSEAAARQLASRARRRVQGVEVLAPDPNLIRHREVVDAFLAASRDGDFEALLAVLAPSVRLRADTTAVQTAAANKWGGTRELPSEINGASAVAEMLQGRARGVQAALLDGVPGAAWAQGGYVRVAWVFGFEQGQIADIDLVMDPARLGELVVVLEGEKVSTT